MIRRVLVIGGLIALALLAWLAWRSRESAPRPPYPDPRSGVHSFFPAPAGGSRTLTIEAATDISYMRPFITAFQAKHSNVSVRYVDSLTSELLDHAVTACARPDATPDLYLSISTDHLVQLANSGCAQRLPDAVTDHVDEEAQWRGEVVAFSLEPAVFVYDRRRLAENEVPKSHLELLEALRGDERKWDGRIGTYNIETAGPGYAYASYDARQAALYGRLIESFGRSHIRIYCCSLAMAQAVGRGEILLAYNVQLSYAYAAQRADRSLGIVLPADFQAIQPRSVMLTRDARNPADAAAFVQFLVSPQGQAIVRRQSAPGPGARPVGSLSNTERASQIVVDTSMLALRDRARRAAFIREWRRAMRPELESASPITPERSGSPGHDGSGSSPPSPRASAEAG